MGEDMGASSHSPAWTEVWSLSGFQPILPGPPKEAVGTQGPSALASTAESSLPPLLPLSLLH